MLVAPPDLSSAHHTLPTLLSFTPVPKARLPFPSVLVASESDPYSTLDAAAGLAEAWGSGLINAGKVGHINTDSGHGRWPEGEEWLQRLLTGISSDSEREPWNSDFKHAALSR